MVSDTDERQGQWAATHLVHRCKKRFVQGWHELPDGAARRWLSVSLVGLGLTAVVTAAMTVGLETWADGTALAWERQFAVWVGRAISSSIAGWISVLGSSLVLWPLMIFAGAMSAWRKKPLQALSFFPGYLGAQLVVTVGWLMWDRHAPRVLTEGAAPSALNSFPSGHVAHTVFAYGLLTYLWWRAGRTRGERMAAAVVFAVITAAVSVGRVAGDAHWPTDVLGAWVVGLLWLAVQVVALRSSEARE